MTSSSLEQASPIWRPVLQIAKGQLNYAGSRCQNAQMKQTMQVTNAKAAAALSNVRQRSLVLQLVGRERSLQELAGLSRMSLSLLHYHVGRLRRLGLIAIANHKPRPGRSIKYYRATARAFFVPTHLVSRMPEEQLSVELRDRLERGRRAGDNDGILFSVDERGSPRMQKLQGKTELPYAEYWLNMKLSNADAQALANDMKSVFRRYQQRTTSRGRDYIAHCALAPK
jgi:DNA-binding transcriptional ArsR family regulator